LLSFKYIAPVTRNFQAFTLGYKNAFDNNVTDFTEYLHRLDSELYFVSVLKMNDESSILLKRKVCWHIRDVLHIHTHKSLEKNIEQDKENTIAKQKKKNEEHIGLYAI